MGDKKQYKIAKSVRSVNTDRTQETVRSVSTDRVTSSSTNTKPISKKTK